MSTQSISIPPAFQSVQDVVDGLSRLEEIFITRQDRRGVFTSAYIQITKEIQSRIAAGLFADNQWLEQYVIAFANLYRIALERYEKEDFAELPKAWKLAFDAATQNRSSYIQDLILGINAHINHDLGLALLEVGIDPQRDSRYRDHTSVNDALQASTNVVQERISEIYAPVLGFIDLAGDELDEVLTNFSFAKARESAWLSGVALVEAGGEAARAKVHKRINDQSAVLGRLILRPNDRYPWLFRALRLVDELLPAWRRPFLGVQRPDLDPVAAPAPVVHSLDEVIERLTAYLERFDRERSRLSVYPTIYLRVTEGIKAALAGGHFEDPEWMTRLDLQFASQYLRIIENFLSGNLDALPGCWRIALQAAVRGDTIVLQDVVLAVNARLNHDLGLALYYSGFLDENTEVRTRDYKKIHDIFAASINPVQTLLAAKYSSVIGFYDRISGTLDEMVVDFAYTQARDNALENAFELGRATSQQEFEAQVEAMDWEASQLAQKLLLRSTILGGWVIAALQYFESQHEGTWSSWIPADLELTLYQRALGADFGRLPPILQRFHRRRQGGIASGSVEVIRGSGLLARFFGSRLKLPPAARRLPVELRIQVDGTREKWLRRFGSVPETRLDAVQYLEEDLLVERVGATRFYFRLSVKGPALRYEQVQVRYGPFRLPRLLSPQTSGQIEAREAGWYIDISLRMPLAGTVLRYHGLLEEQSSL